ncbi:MAG: sigma-70 family RNA polymerase sigma factor [Fibromonadaceae bacterium]|nr:sigma-70 family RNA polymerase sigma factor [Fibromonadaceae bacterium]
MRIDSNDVALKRYLDDIRKTSPLTREEEALLLENKNNPVARQKIIDANMRFVVKVAIQYRGCPIPISDLMSEGAMGLMRAIETFDNSRGIKFITYGVWWIKAYITKAINEQGNLVRLPANQHLRIRKGLKDQAMGQDVSEEIKSLILMGQKGVSIDSPLKADSKSSYAESLPDAAAIDPEAHSEIQAVEDGIRSILKALPPREYSVLAGLYGVGFDTPQTLRAVGEAMNISHERVRQLRDQALKRITHTVTKDYLKENLEALAKAKQNQKH